MLSSTCNELTIYFLFWKVNMIIVLICWKNMTIFSRMLAVFYFFKKFHTELEKIILRNTLYGNVRLFAAIHKIEEWSQIGSWHDLCILMTLI